MKQLIFQLIFAHQKSVQQIKYIFQITSSISKMSIQERKKNPSAFLRNIFRILQNPEFNGIIEWAPSGNGFIIKNLLHFQSKILPQYFKHKKYSSFVRQLNMYGFHKQRNCNFENCFLHEHFKRGEELPTEIKRKPEKKKKISDQSEVSNLKEGNWLTFSRQLRQHLPHIADNVLVRSEGQRKKNILLTRSNNSFHPEDLIPNPIVLNNHNDQEQYVSKISLKGFIDDCEKNPQAINLGQVFLETLARKSESEIQNSNSQNDQANLSNYNQSESEINDSTDKKSFSSLKIKKQTSTQNKQLPSSFSFTEQNLFKSNNFSILSFTTNQGTLDSLNSLGEILVRQNEIIRKTHPFIRNMVSKSQRNRISYLNQQIESTQDNQRKTNEFLRQQKQKIHKILENEKQQINKLTDILQQQIHSLIQLMVSQDQIPLSVTSIRGRLDK